MPSLPCTMRRLRRELMLCPSVEQRPSGRSGRLDPLASLLFVCLLLLVTTGLDVRLFLHCSLWCAAGCRSETDRRVRSVLQWHWSIGHGARRATSVGQVGPDQMIADPVV